MTGAAPDDHVAAMRRFNRFYTQTIGVLHEGLSGSRFSLAEARLLYELAHRERPTASDIGRDLGLDAGYMSRLLRGLQRQKLIARDPASDDRRRRHLTLTAAGRDALAPLDRAARHEIAALLAPLAADAQRRLVAAMREVEGLLNGRAGIAAPAMLRPPRPGDLGWVVSRHGALYAEEYGFDARFEALVAEVAAACGKSFDPRYERCWIAEQAGVPVGSVFLARDSDELGKLRLLLVEPAARGHGVGHRLVGECVAFARAAGYRRLGLWTQSILLAARQIYREAGFRLVRSQPHHSFGCDLVGEDWELEL
jgi:DNA-binding MarR family transcriptional regulator